MLEMSDWVKSFYQSDVSIVLKLSLMKDIISFVGGLPTPKAFPAEKISEVTSRALAHRGGHSLQYTPTVGMPEALEAVRYRMKVRGVEASLEELALTGGSQMAMNMLLLMLANRGDWVIVEEPSFMAAIELFRAYGMNMVSVPMDGEGVIPTALRERLKTLKRDGIPARFIYTLPNYHNPAGASLSQKRRQELVEIATEYDTCIVEDDAYSELNYDNIDQTPVKAYDRDNRVFYIGTCTKIIAPGIRLGWIHGDPELIRAYGHLRPMIDVFPNSLSQEILIGLTRDGFLDNHIKSLCKMYAVKRDTMRAGLETYMPEGVTWYSSPGGFYFWVQLPEGITCKSVFDRALEKKVGFTPGTFFYTDWRDTGCFRLSYSMPDEDAITEGTRRLGTAVQEVLK